MSHESFQEYATRWRLEDSKIHPPLPEEELISAFIQIQEGLYYDKFLRTCARNFSDLIRIGHDNEDCPALRFKIQNMIESGKIKLLQEPPTNNGDIANTSTIFVKGDPSKLVPRHLKRKRATSQKD
ncbi:hypothetical protein HAX54_017118 [Datura stramonium]|uniref:Retrotransposon gag domain-containing protein n=1 Tax=Datura stramonium TaxID=4076 RepID=A0ABS8UME3_DATST|nr:hypothetical protein [Datura stramonium]